MYSQESELQSERGISTELRNVTEELKQKVAAPFFARLLAIVARKTPMKSPEKGKNMPVNMVIWSQNCLLKFGYGHEPNPINRHLDVQNTMS